MAASVVRKQGVCTRLCMCGACQQLTELEVTVNLGLVATIATSMYHHLGALAIGKTHMYIIQSINKARFTIDPFISPLDENFSKYLLELRSRDILLILKDHLVR